MNINKNTKKVIYLFLGFLGFMLSCTLVSRGMYASRMPQIKTGKPVIQRLTHKLELPGVLEKKSSEITGSRCAVYGQPGMRIEGIAVKASDKVNPGDVLFQVNLEDVRKSLKKLEKTVEEARQEKQSIKEQEQLSHSEWERKKSQVRKRGQEDIQSARREQNILVRREKKEYLQAKKELEEYPSWEQYFSDAAMQSEQYQELQREAQKAAASVEEKSAFENFVTRFRASAKKEWESGRQALYKVEQEAYDSWKEAVEGRTNTLENLRREKKRELEDMQRQDSNQEKSLQKQSEIIRQAEEEMETYQKLLREDGKVTCDMEGTVQEVRLGTGDMMSEGAVMVLTEMSEQWQFRAVLPAEQKKYMDRDLPVDLVFEEGQMIWEQMEIERIQRRKDGDYQIVVDVQGQKGKKNMQGVLRVDSESSSAACCVPLSALYSDIQGNYVLTVEEKEGFLGKEFIVKKRGVTVEDKNGEYASLSGTDLSEEEDIVVMSDREVKPDEQVRMVEE